MEGAKQEAGRLLLGGVQLGDVVPKVALAGLWALEAVVRRPLASLPSAEGESWVLGGLLHQAWDLEVVVLGQRLDRPALLQEVASARGALLLVVAWA